MPNFTPPRPRMSEWLALHPGKPAPNRFTERLYSDSTIDAPSVVSNYEYLLGALRSRAPGQHSSNTQVLANQLTSGIFLAINTQQKQVEISEWKIMEKTHDKKVGDKELDENDPCVQFFQDPNNEDEWVDVASGDCQQLGLTGMALNWIPKLHEKHLPDEMYMVPTATALPWPPSPVYPHGSYLIQPYYPYGPFSTIPSYQSAAGARIPAEQIVRIKNIHPLLRYDGYAVLTAIQRHVDTVNMIDFARWSVQQRGIDPTVAMTFDPALFNPQTTDLVRIRKQIEAVAAGPANAGKILFNPLGGTISKISNTPSEMAWKEGWEQLMSFELACFGTPKAVAGLNDDTSYANLYASLKQSNILTMAPLLGRICRPMNKQVVRPWFGKDLYLKMEPQRIDDRDLLEKQLQTDLQAKIRRKNEWRVLRGLPPIEGPEGDEWVGPGPLEQKPGMDAMASQQQPLASTKIGDKDESRLQMHRDEIQGKPTNATDGRGSLGSRKSYDADRLADILDRAKVNGHAVPIEDYDDGAAAYLKNGKHHRS